MKPETRLMLAINDPSLEVITGSNLYGTSRPQSDIDRRGFCIVPPEYSIGMHRFEVARDDETDREIRSLEKFFQELLKGNTHCLETLFAPDVFVLRADKFGYLVRENRHLFLSRRYLKSLLGFASTEMRRVRGTKMVVEKRKPTEQSVIDQIREIFRLPKPDMDEVLEVLDRGRSRKEVPYHRDMGAKRKTELEEYGYCVSGATHAIRLLHQALELSRYGTLTFPRPEKELLREIRSGQLPKEAIEDLYAELDSELDSAIEGSVLPKNPDYHAVEELQIQILSEAHGWS